MNTDASKALVPVHTTIDTTNRGWTDTDTIREWLHDLSDNSRKAYHTDITDFRTFTNKPLDYVTVSDLQAYQDSLSDLADTTQARKIASIKSLLSYALKMGYIRVNVGLVVKLPPIKDKLAERIMSREQMETLLAHETDAYNHALLRLLYASGMRVSEVCDLTWRDVQARENGKAQLTVYGKGSKTRHVLISADTYRELRAIRNDQTANLNTPVFPNLYPRKAERIVEKAGSRIGLDGVSPHWFRHANASHALDKHAPIHVVQATLGHKSLETTSKYTHVRPNDSTGEYLGI